MPLDPALANCAPWVAPETLAAVVRVESGDLPWALHVNGGLKVPRPRTAAEAALWARRVITAGGSVDLGYMQVNSRHLSRLGLTVEQVLVPCANIRAGATILAADYAAASRSRGPGRAALLAALSAYNTGDFERGFSNGYVARYLRTPARRPPAGVRPAGRYAAAATVPMTWSHP